MSNKVRYGLRNVHYAKVISDGTYATPKAIPGSVTLELSAEGGSTPFFADDTKYFEVTANNGYTGNLTLAYLPDSDRVALLGETMDAEGVLFETSDDTPGFFALLFEVQGDAAARRYCFYNCKLSRPGETHNTKNETVTPDTQALPITVMPKKLDTRNIVKSSVEYSAETAAAYSDWFSAVNVPGAGIPEA